MGEALEVAARASDRLDSLDNRRPSFAAMNRRELDVSLPRSWDTAAAALSACARSLGDPRDFALLHAASGLAFRLSVDARLTAAGPHRYPWREVLTVAAERLGYRWRLVAANVGEPLFEAARKEAFALAVEGVDAGRPTLLFGVQAAEFGIVRGYDRAGAEPFLLVSGILDAVGAPRQIAGDALGRDTGILFALQLIERVPVDAAVAARSALRAAVNHRNEDESSAVVATGDAGWARFVSALESGAVDPSGLAYNVQRYAEARASAATYLPSAAAALKIDLSDGERAARRAATMLAEAARLLPFPPPATGMLTTTLREQAIELVGEAARAEAEALKAIERALVDEARSAEANELAIVALDATRLPMLFACVDEIPLAGLRAEAATCRKRLAPSLPASLGGRLLVRGDALVGHVLWAPLEGALYPVTARGRRWFLFCPWLAEALRGHGLGARLFAALDEAANAEGIDGLLTFATSIDVFLHHHGLERYGFVEVDRRGDTRLLERRLTALPSEARLTDPPPAEPAPKALKKRSLPVIARHAYNCPLLLRVRTDAVAAARALAPHVTVDEADATAAEPSGITVAGLALAHGPIPASAIAAGLANEVSHRR